MVTVHIVLALMIPVVVSVASMISVVIVIPSKRRTARQR